MWAPLPRVHPPEQLQRAGSLIDHLQNLENSLWIQNQALVLPSQQCTSVTYAAIPNKPRVFNVKPVSSFLRVWSIWICIVFGNLRRTAFRQMYFLVPSIGLDTRAYTKRWNFSKQLGSHLSLLNHELLGASPESTFQSFTVSIILWSFKVSKFPYSCDVEEVPKFQSFKVSVFLWCRIKLQSFKVSIFLWSFKVSNFQSFKV